MQLKIVFTLLLFSGFLSYSQKYPVNFTVNYLQPYCGGARPSAEILQRSKTPQAYQNKTIVLVNSKKKAIKAKTNAEGKIITKLKADTYKLYENWRFYGNTPDASNKKNYVTDCLKTEWIKEFGILVVDAKGSNYTETNIIVAYCNWAMPCMIDSLRPAMPE